MLQSLYISHYIYVPFIFQFLPNPCFEGAPNITMLTIGSFQTLFSGSQTPGAL